MELTMTCGSIADLSSLLINLGTIDFLEKGSSNAAVEKEPLPFKTLVFVIGEFRRLPVYSSTGQW